MRRSRQVDATLIPVRRQPTQSTGCATGTNERRRHLGKISALPLPVRIRTGRIWCWGGEDDLLLWPSASSCGLAGTHSGTPTRPLLKDSGADIKLVQESLPKTGRVFLITAEYGPVPPASAHAATPLPTGAPAWMRSPRPPMIPGSFQILVVGK